MTDVKEELEQLNDKVSRMLAAYDEVKAENQRLKLQISTLTTTMQGQRKKLEELENKNLNLQISKTFGKGEEGKALLRQKLDEFITEIDKCIAQLEE